MRVSHLIKKSAKCVLTFAVAASLSFAVTTPAQALAPGAPVVTLTPNGVGAWTVSWTPADNEVLTGWDVHVFDKDGEVFPEDADSDPSAPTHTCADAIADKDVTSCEVTRVSSGSAILVTVAPAYGEGLVGAVTTKTSDQTFTVLPSNIVLSIGSNGVIVTVAPQVGIDSYFVTAKNVSSSDPDANPVPNDVTLDVESNQGGTWTVKNVVSGDDIQVSVQPIASAITSAQVFNASVFTVPLIPNAPINVTAVLLSSSSATISWTAPVNTGGAAITGYTVTSSPEGKTCSWTTGTLNCTVMDLTKGTPYTFTVVATNASGNSISSAVSNSVTPVTSTETGDGAVDTSLNSPGDTDPALVIKTDPNVTSDLNFGSGNGGESGFGMGLSPTGKITPKAVSRLVGTITFVMSFSDQSKSFKVVTCPKKKYKDKAKKICKAPVLADSATCTLVSTKAKTGKEFTTFQPFKFDACQVNAAGLAKLKGTVPSLRPKMIIKSDFQPFWPVNGKATAISKRDNKSHTATRRKATFVIKFG